MTSPSTHPVSVRARIIHTLINITVIALTVLRFVFHTVQYCLDGLIDLLEDRRP